MNTTRVIKMIGMGMVISCCLTGCSSGSVDVVKEVVPSSDVKTSLVQKDIKPKVLYRASAEKRMDLLEKQLATDFKIEGAQAFYCYNFVDLNNDQSNEILVFLRLQSSDGATVISQQFTIYDSTYKQIFLSSEIIAPIVILNQKHNNWLDLAVYESKGHYRRIIMGKEGYELGEKSNENVINFDELEGVCYLSNVKNEIGFSIK